MASIEAKAIGKIIHALPIESGVGKASGKHWQRQTYVLECVDGQYTSRVSFDLWGDLVDKERMQVGDEVCVHLSIDAREYNGRWYNSLKGYKIERVGNTFMQAPAMGYQQSQANVPTFQGVGTAQPTPPDDLPF